MDEQLLKKTVQSIEMPEEMKERIIENCRSGEGKPLFPPKKRLVYMPMAVTACVCVMVAALAGVGIWQMKALSEGNNEAPAEDISDRIINIIPLTTEEVEAAKYEVDLKWDDYKMYRDEQLADYFGIDLTALSGIFPDVLLHWPVDSYGRGVYSTDNGIYFDRNTYFYVDERTGDRNFQITASRLGIPNSIKKLWSDEEMLSRINGTTVAIGKWQDMTVYEAEFSTSAGTYFHITAFSSIDDLATFITTIIEKTEQYPNGTPENTEQYPNGTPLTLDKLREICSDDPSKLSWDDFKGYRGKEIGSGLYILQYDIEDKYTLLIGGVPEDEPGYMIFSLIGAKDGIDIREGGLEDYIAAHADDSPIVPLTLEKLKEICKGDTSKLSWSDFEQFESTSFGSGLLYLQYDIEDRYTLTIGGAPNVEPYCMDFRVEGQYYAIDIREDSIDEYLSQPVPEGDVINIVPLKEDEINYSMSADFEEGEPIWPTDQQLSEYFGIDITSFGNIPSGMAPDNDIYGDRYIWYKDGGVCYDKNEFRYSIPDKPAWVNISVGTLMNSLDKLWEEPKMRSMIDGRIVAIGQTEEGYYVAELLSADSVLGIHVQAWGISFEEFCDVLSALVEKTEVRDCVNEDYPYPWLYIDALQMQGNGKDNYQDDPAEFVFGVQHIIQDSDTVEEMYQALAEFDTEGRIDKVLLSLDGVPVADGDIRQGMYCEVYYDNETSWFSFNI